MYDTRFPPRLELRYTISHPLEELRVIGFEGRDPVYGRDAVVVKRDAIPEHGGKAGLPEDVVKLVEDDFALYIISDTDVLAGVPELGEPEEFDTFYGRIFFDTVETDSLTQFERDAVEVSLP